MIKYQEISCGGRLKKWVLTKYVTLIKDMYTNVVTCVGACDGKSDIFSIKIGLH
jgi:hypothetical protein